MMTFRIGLWGHDMEFYKMFDLPWLDTNLFSNEMVNAKYNKIFKRGKCTQKRKEKKKLINIYKYKMYKV